MLSGAYQVGKVWGIPIRLHWSLLIPLFLFARDFQHYGGWLFGLLVGIGFFASIVLHELGHSLVALRQGCRVRQITLLVIGGAAQMDRIPHRPWQEFTMTIAGPLVSFALAGLGWVLSGWSALPRPLGAYCLIMFYINFTLGLFNLIPAFPMDGGRILRAMLTPRYGRLRATASAARLSQIIAVCGGLYGLFHGHFLTVLVAFFVYRTAGQELRYELLLDQARRGAQPPPLWSFFGGPPPAPPPLAEDQVSISPPPYAPRGPAQQSDVRPETPRGRWFRAE